MWNPCQSQVSFSDIEWFTSINHVTLDIKAVSVAAGIDNSVAVSNDSKAYSWGYSQNYRTALRTENTVQSPTLITNSTISMRKVTFAGCGGQFLVLAGPRILNNGV